MLSPTVTVDKALQGSTTLCKKSSSNPWPADEATNDHSAEGALASHCSGTSNLASRSLDGGNPHLVQPSKGVCHQHRIDDPKVIVLKAEESEYSEVVQGM